MVKEGTDQFLLRWSDAVPERRGPIDNGIPLRTSSTASRLQPVIK
jgi:hypothetical protein